MTIFGSLTPKTPADIPSSILVFTTTGVTGCLTSLLSSWWAVGGGRWAVAAAEAAVAAAAVVVVVVTTHDCRRRGRDLCTSFWYL